MKTRPITVTTTRKIIDSFRGLPGEWYMLKGLLCADRSMEYNSLEYKAYNSVVNGVMIASRMDELNRE